MTDTYDYAELAKIEARARLLRAQVVRDGSVALRNQVAAFFGTLFARTNKAA